MADLILPSNTKMEEQDIAVDNFSGQFHTVMYEEQCIAPLGESMSDYEIVCKVAERLGLAKEYTGGRSVQEWIDLGFSTSGVQDQLSYEEFKSKRLLRGADGRGLGRRSRPVCSSSTKTRRTIL